MEKEAVENLSRGLRDEDWKDFGESTNHSTVSPEKQEVVSANVLIFVMWSRMGYLKSGIRTLFTIGPLNESRTVFLILEKFKQKLPKVCCGSFSTFSFGSCRRTGLTRGSSSDTTSTIQKASVLSTIQILGFSALFPLEERIPVRDMVMMIRKVFGR